MQTTDNIDLLLRRHPFLAGLDSRLFNYLSECASIRRFASRQEIFHEGAEADHFYLIVGGAVDLETSVPGCGRITIQTLKSGDVLGWSWLFQPHRWQFTAVTRAPTEVISLDADHLRMLCDESGKLRDELLTRTCKTMLERLAATRGQLVELHRARSRNAASDDPANS